MRWDGGQEIRASITPHYSRRMLHNKKMVLLTCIDLWLMLVADFLGQSLGHVHVSFNWNCGPIDWLLETS